jgi:hypothetical protein
LLAFQGLHGRWRSGFISAPHFLLRRSKVALEAICALDAVKPHAAMKKPAAPFKKGRRQYEMCV